VPALTIQFHFGGVYLPELRLWLDAHQAKRGPEKVFVSHAHADHVRAHREVILSAPTARLMSARLGATAVENILPFGETRAFDGGGAPYGLTLLPAGHIFGSAMAFLEAEGQSLLYTGDFKLRRSLSAEACEPRRADMLIMETTFGRAQYRFPPLEVVLRGIIRFCREALDNDETAVLLGYSLGKSQELLRGLADAGLPIVLHEAVHKLTQIYEEFGQRFPEYERFHPATAHRKVLLCPPGFAGSAVLRALGPARRAVLTGWAVDPDCRYRYRADAAFPLSDHADFPELIDFVRQVAPKKVYTLHGFAADFAQTLRDLGVDAQALSEEEQLALPLQFRKTNSLPPSEPNLPRSDPDHPPLRRSYTGNECSSSAESISAAPNFRTVAEAGAAIAGTSSKSEKVRLLAEHLKTLDLEDLGRVVIWFTGRPFAGAAATLVPPGWALLRDALAAAAGIDAGRLREIFLQHSDLAETAFEVFSPCTAAPLALSIAAVDEMSHQIHSTRERAARLAPLIHTLRHCSPLEARFLVKIVTGDLRIGLKEDLVKLAIAGAFHASVDEVGQANLLLGDLGEAARRAKQGNLGSTADHQRAAGIR
jgi:DNA ligase-1